MKGWSVPERLALSRCTVRRFRRNDLEAFVRFMMTPEVTRPLAFSETQKTLSGARALLEQTVTSYQSSVPTFLLVIAAPASDDLLGLCGLSPTRHAGTAECFWALLPESQRKGLATEAVRALAEYAFRRLGLNRLTATIAPSNHASRRVAERIGMHDAGPSEDGAWRIFTLDA